MIKLSELSSGKACDVLCELTPYIAGVVEDKKLLDTLAEKIGRDKSAAEIYVYGARKAATLVPILLKDHRADLFGVLAVLNETTPEAIEAQNVLTTIRQVQEVGEDKDLLDFFGSLRAGGRGE